MHGTRERMGFQEHARRYASVLAKDLDRLPWEALERAADLILQAARTGRTIFLFGNGAGPRPPRTWRATSGRGPPRMA